MRAAAAALLSFVSICAYGRAQYRPEVQVSGTIRSWGSAQMAELMAIWEGGFRHHHPAVRFEDRLNGTVSGMGGLYSGATDLSLMGREIWATEAMAYEQITGHPATGVKVAMGSFDVPTKADTLVLFVHGSNPITALTLVQLRGIFGCGDGVIKTIQSWGQLGVPGALADKPLHVYGYKLDNAASMFFKSSVLNNSEWRCGIKTFGNETSGNGKRMDSGQLILDALKSDPYGIAISNPHYASADVKALALATDSGATPIAPTKTNVASGAYPLSRSIYIFYNRPPNQAPQPRVREFLRYVLSKEGQQDVVQEGAYLPLPEHIRQKQLSMLD